MQREKVKSLTSIVPVENNFGGSLDRDNLLPAFCIIQCRMNVSEQQKRIILNYMRSNPDFGRGRLRYAGENKRKMNQMWAEVAQKLNSVGSGPQKLAKEWNKTWRDLQTNTLKKAADNKAYASCTGGGPPKVKEITPLEMELLDFLTPEAAGLSNILEGGFRFLKTQGTKPMDSNPHNTNCESMELCTPKQTVQCFNKPTPQKLNRTAEFNKTNLMTLRKNHYFYPKSHQGTRFIIKNLNWMLLMHMEQLNNETSSTNSQRWIFWSKVAM